MGPTLRAAALALSLAGAAAPAAAADPDPMGRMVEDTVDFAARTAGWCVRGAAFAVVVSSAFALPAVASGIASPIGLTEIAAMAGAGCAFSVVWGTALTTAGWAYGQFSGPAAVGPGPGTPIRFQRPTGPLHPHTLAPLP